MILQPYDMEVGAGTFHTATFLRAVGPEPWRAAYVQPSRRPTDGRYGENPFRLQHYYQYQVVIKPSPLPILDLYLGSLAALGLDPLVHDVRFVEDNWESPTLGAWGLGWEVWLNGMEVTQFTYFQQVGGLDCRPVTGEITYGLERLAMYLQGVESIYDILWSDGPGGRVTYGDVFHQNEVEQSKYNFEHADVPSAAARTSMTTSACARSSWPRSSPCPPTSRCSRPRTPSTCWMRARAISVTERQRYILRVRTLASAVARSLLREPRGAGLPAAEGRRDRSIRRGHAMKIEHRDFLLEIGTEELPPRALLALSEALVAGIGAGLDKAQLGHGELTGYATPRRLAVWVKRLAGRQPEQNLKRKGPPLSASFDGAGAPTRAALAFADSCGTAVAALTRLDEGKGTFLFFIGDEAGRTCRRHCCLGSCRRHWTACRSRGACTGVRAPRCSCARCTGW